MIMKVILKLYAKIYENVFFLISILNFFIKLLNFDLDFENKDVPVKSLFLHINESLKKTLKYANFNFFKVFVIQEIH